MNTQSVNTSGIPPALSAIPQWVLWNNEPVPTKPRGNKVPKYNVAGKLYNASSTNPATWSEFNSVCKDCSDFNASGIGFVLTRGPRIFCIDIDECISPDGTVSDFAQSVLSAFKNKTYIEISFHGDGLHIFGLGCLPTDESGGKREGDDGGIEIFDAKRFIAITGNRLDVSGPELTDCQKELDALVARFPKTKTSVAPEIPHKNSPRLMGSLSDSLGWQCIDIARPDGQVRCKGNEVRGSHPFHDSKTGDNFSVNTQSNVWKCWRHETGGGPLELYAMKNGIISCDDSKPGCLDGKWGEIFECMESEGIDVNNLIHGVNMSQVDVSGILNQTSSGMVAHPNEVETGVCNFQEEHDAFEKKKNETRKRIKLPEFSLGDINGTIGNYMEFATNASWSQPEFHLAAFITIASMAIGRRVVIRTGTAQAYCNIFALVAGVSTISGKSAACNLGINKLGPEVFYEEPVAVINGVSQITGTHSVAALVQEMSEISNRLWYYDEAGEFFENADNNWNSNIIQELCKAYDGTKLERSLSSRNKGGTLNKFVCMEPYLTLLFNCTTTDLEKAASSKMFTSGFFPRFMVFWAEGGAPRKNVDISDHEKQVLESVQSDLRQMKDDLYKLDNDSIAFGVCDIIEEWYLQRIERYTGREDEPVRIAYGRAFMHAYKLAAIFTLINRETRREVISRKDTGLQKLSDACAIQAITIIDNYFVPRMVDISKMLFASDVRNHQVILIKALRHYGGVATMKQLYSYTKLNVVDMKKAIGALVEGEIATTETRRDNEAATKPTTYVFLGA